MSLNTFFLKKLKEMAALLEAICHELQQGLSIMNPGPMTCRWLIPQQVLTVIEIKEIGDCSLAWFRSMGLQVVKKMQELERASERSVLAPGQYWHLEYALHNSFARSCSSSIRSSCITSSVKPTSVRKGTSPQEVLCCEYQQLMLLVFYLLKQLHNSGLLKQKKNQISS